jgi:glycosyltransferase involved in cell wall biosynthesis|tara:strand:- start:28 stop:1302 length:1275 start_codon:yes stop_codon:yes gene_type:complete
VRKIKVLTISDHPLSPSGVGTQTKYMIEALLQSGKFEVVSLGGAIKHPDHKPQKTEQYGDLWKIYPVDGYGTADAVRSILRTERPDILWFMTDPRFFPWLWIIEQEVRPLVPMIYYHVWDNKPYPMFNKRFYDSNDKVVTISKVTDEIVRNVSPDVDTEYLPHAVDGSIFAPMSQDSLKEFRNGFYNIPEGEDDNKITFFWNNRNARRKQSGSLIWWFKEFLDDVGHDKARLVMHTDPHDQHGQDLVAIMNQTGMVDGQVLLSTQKISPDRLAMMYNAADCTVNISDAEGFGLATLESLSCGTPIIVTMTGGLQEQVTDGTNWFGIGLEPSSKAVIGSQDVPYIYEDRISSQQLVSALKKVYEMSSADRSKLGLAGREHTLNNYNFQVYTDRWVSLLEEAYEHYGSWNHPDGRKNYKGWEHTEL